MAAPQDEAPDLLPGLRRVSGTRRRHNQGMEPERRRLPPWLMGLILAIALLVTVLVVANLLGYGDDPVVGALR